MGKASALEQAGQHKLNLIGKEGNSGKQSYPNYIRKDGKAEKDIREGILQDDNYVQNTLATILNNNNKLSILEGDVDLLHISFTFSLFSYVYYCYFKRQYVFFFKL